MWTNGMTINEAQFGDVSQGGVGASIGVLNGIPEGVSYDPGLSRPYLHSDGRVWVDVTVGHQERKDASGQIVINEYSGMPEYERVTEAELVSERMRRDLPVIGVNNATVLPKEAWIRLDGTVAMSVRKRLRLWADLRARVTYGGFDGMATPILERELVTDPGEAVVDMEGLSEGRNFQPSNALQGLPLPITSSSFWISERFLAASRNSGRPLDTQRAGMAGRRIGEMIERTAIGSVAGMTYGAAAAGSYLQTSKVYGLITHPARITKTNLTTSATIMTNIATTGGDSFVTDVFTMVELAKAQNFFGPFILYVSSGDGTTTGYDRILNRDYKATVTGTIRSRVLLSEDISDIRRLDYLDGDVLLLVEMDPDVIQAISGLEIITVQETVKFGMQHNFKTLCIQVPWVKSAFKSGTTTEVTGIVHGTTS